MVEWGIRSMDCNNKKRYKTTTFGIVNFNKLKAVNKRIRTIFYEKKILVFRHFCDKMSSDTPSEIMWNNIKIFKKAVVLNDEIKEQFLDNLFSSGPIL